MVWMISNHLCRLVIQSLVWQNDSQTLQVPATFTVIASLYIVQAECLYPTAQTTVLSPVSLKSLFELLCNTP